MSGAPRSRCRRVIVQIGRPATKQDDLEFGLARAVEVHSDGVGIAYLSPVRLEVLRPSSGSVAPGDWADDQPNSLPAELTRRDLGGGLIKVDDAFQGLIHHPVVGAQARRCAVRPSWLRSESRNSQSASIVCMTTVSQLDEIKPDGDLSCIGNWFVGDVEGARHMASYARPEEWRKLLSSSRRGWFFTSAATGRAVGFIDLEIDGETGYFSYYIAPASRGTGLGAQALRALIELARQLGIGDLKGGVEPDNVASIAALKRVGFQLLDLDEDDMFPVWMELAGGENR